MAQPSRKSISERAPLFETSKLERRGEDRGRRGEVIERNEERREEERRGER